MADKDKEQTRMCRRSTSIASGTAIALLISLSNPHLLRPANIERAQAGAALSNISYGLGRGVKERILLIETCPEDTTADDSQ
jgi:hypothetical protein